MITIINYGMGNIRSIVNAIEYLGYKTCITDNPEIVKGSSKLILPGVGSFNKASQNLYNSGLANTIIEAVCEKKIPILGICLGMQLLANEGYEDGFAKGLGLIDASIIKFSFDNELVKIPHVGFNTVEFNSKNRLLFEGLHIEADFYFVHSFKMECNQKKDISSVTNYGGEMFVSSVCKGNIFGTQFHPEKSQNNGLTVMDNFCKLEV